MKRAAGFTLLEVLASLALLALLMAGVYAGIRTAIRSVRSGTAQVERLDQIRSAQQFLRRELAQALAQTIGRGDNDERLVFEGTERELRYVAPLPGYLGKLGPQLQTLRLVDDGEGGWRLELSLALLPPDGRPPQSLGDPQVLLEHVHSGRFSYRGVDAQGRAVPWQANWPDGRLLPRLVRIELQPQGNVGWPTLEMPLRIDPGSEQSGLMSLRMHGAGLP